jgi:hypothetical protein
VTVLVYTQEPTTGDLWLESSLTFLACDARCAQQTLTFCESSWGTRVAAYTFSASGALVGMRLGGRGGILRQPAEDRSLGVPTPAPALPAAASRTERPSLNAHERMLSELVPAPAQIPPPRRQIELPSDEVREPA